MTVDGQLVSSKKTLTLPVMVNVNFLIVFITRVIVTWALLGAVVTRGYFGIPEVFIFFTKVFWHCSFYPGQRSFSREFFIILLHYIVIYIMNLLSGARDLIFRCPYYTESVLWVFFLKKIYENFVETLEIVRNREVSVLYQEVRQTVLLKLCNRTSLCNRTERALWSSYKTKVSLVDVLVLSAAFEKNSTPSSSFLNGKIFHHHVRLDACSCRQK